MKYVCKAALYSCKASSKGCDLVKIIRHLKTHVCFLFSEHLDMYWTHIIAGIGMTMLIISFCCSSLCALWTVCDADYHAFITILLSYDMIFAVILQHETEQESQTTLWFDCYSMSIMTFIHFVLSIIYTTLVIRFSECCASSFSSSSICDASLIMVGVTAWYYFFYGAAVLGRNYE